MEEVLIIKRFIHFKSVEYICITIVNKNIYLPVPFSELIIAFSCSFEVCMDSLYLPKDLSSKSFPFSGTQYGSIVHISQKKNIALQIFLGS